jgi:hypothetical protein
MSEVRAAVMPPKKRQLEIEELYQRIAALEQQRVPLGNAASATKDTNLLGRGRPSSCLPRELPTPVREDGLKKA